MSTRCSWMLASMLAASIVLMPSARCQVETSPPKADAPCEFSALDLTKKDGINWAPDLPTAMARAVKEDKPVLLVWNVRKLGNLLDPEA